VSFRPRQNTVMMILMSDDSNDNDEDGNEDADGVHDDDDADESISFR